MIATIEANSDWARREVIGIINPNFHQMASVINRESEVNTRISVFQNNGSSRDNISITARFSSDCGGSAFTKSRKFVILAIEADGVGRRAGSANKNFFTVQEGLFNPAVSIWVQGESHALSRSSQGNRRSRADWAIFTRISCDGGSWAFAFACNSVVFSIVADFNWASINVLYIINDNFFDFAVGLSTESESDTGISLLKSKMSRRSDASVWARYDWDLGGRAAAFGCQDFWISVVADFNLVIGIE